jgi:DNA ligase-1
VNREFLMLAHTYKPGKYDVSGWYASEKLDGSRCFWDGGLTRGVPTHEVPWANITDPKNGNPKAKISPVSTGLWSRYGNPIIAPDWFLNQLPCMFLDGELWAGRGNFQLCRSIISRDVPDDRAWKDHIQFPIFSSPTPEKFATTGMIKNANMKKMMSEDIILRFLKSRDIELGGGFRRVSDGSTFDIELLLLKSSLGDGPAYLHTQKRLTALNAANAVEMELARILEVGGEGLVLRDPTMVWEPRRLRSILKYKPFSDDEGTLVGFTTGRETDKGSKHLGKIGALILDYNGKRLELSGLTDEEREFADKDRFYATTIPGRDMPAGCHAKHFRVGDKVTFRYREFSDGGVPKEARYYRKRNEE